MTRILAMTRRFFMVGTIAMILLVMALQDPIAAFVSSIKSHSQVSDFVTIFIFLCPLLFIVFTLFSVSYIRSNGDFSAIHESQPWIVSLFRCLLHDIASPFKTPFLLIWCAIKRDEDSRNEYLKRLLCGIITIVLFVIAIGLSYR